MFNKPIILPPDLSGKRKNLPLCTRKVVIIGANGSGKSRFMSSLGEIAGKNGVRVSSLKGLYDRDENGETGLDTIIRQLFDDEIESLVRFKFNRAAGENSQLEYTRLDRLVTLWQEIYPGNRMLPKGSRMMFMRAGQDDSYTVGRLSDGEKAVVYLIGRILYAPENSILLIESPEMFLHQTITQSVWNRLEQLRPDCMMIYSTHDLEFASSRNGASVVWIKSYDSLTGRWDYSILPPGSTLNEDIYMAIIGARKPVLFIEGDSVHSIDAQLYPLIFPEFSVKSLGSCNKVVEATRTFNDLNYFHKLAATGIVDRDRRDEKEVAYLRKKNIMVPDVAEIENLLLAQDVIRVVAAARGLSPDKILEKVKSNVIAMFTADYKEQALQHTRHKLKKSVEYNIDRKFASINELETHFRSLPDEIAPAKYYSGLCREFKSYISQRDYDSILKVYNQKTMLAGSNVSALLGLHSRGAYLNYILELLSKKGPQAKRLRSAFRKCFLIGNEESEQHS